ncbi:MAG: hypothetical protein LQ352_000952 [Teloschistes flavicans]|nr:MAG: hypothetical protein LQ352_000952 [Teloschistes flavicans]
MGPLVFSTHAFRFLCFIYCVNAYPRLGEVVNNLNPAVGSNSISPHRASTFEVSLRPYLSKISPRLDITLPSLSEVSSNVGWKRSLQARGISERGLHLKFSTISVTAVNGYTLYASPIALPDLLVLLLATYRDLSLSHVRTDLTNEYHYNTSVWSFEVAVADGTIHYSSILSIVKGFLQLMQGPHVSIITQSFAACLYKDTDAIADIAIIPSATNVDSISTDIEPENGDTSQSTPDIPTALIQVDTISPTGIITTTDTISSSALDIFDPNPNPLKKRLGSALDHEMVVKVASTTLYIARHILLRNDREHENANPIVAAALPYFFNAAIIIACSSFALGFVTERSMDPYYDPDLLGKVPFVDSRIFRVGRLTARFYMWSTLRDQDGRKVGFAAKVWDALVKQFLRVAERAPQDTELYATEGSIRGKDPVNGTDDYVTWGRWEWNVRGMDITRGNGAE